MNAMAKINNFKIYKHPNKLSFVSSATYIFSTNHPLNAPIAYNKNKTIYEKSIIFHPKK